MRVAREIHLAQNFAHPSCTPNVIVLKIKKGAMLRYYRLVYDNGRMNRKHTSEDYSSTVAGDAFMRIAVLLHKKLCYFVDRAAKHT